MGGPTFANERVVHILEKNNIVLNCETKVRRRLLLYAFKFILTNIESELIDKSAIISTQRWTNSLGIVLAFKLILTNIQSELIDKSTIISTRRWTNSLGRAHSRMASPI